MSDSDELIELTIGAPAHGGSCVARDDSGRVVFVRFALPGEKVRARVIDSHKRMLWAEAVEILEPSPDRIPSVWPAAGPGGVGGGELSFVSPEGGRRWKTEVLEDQLRRIGRERVAEQVEAIGGVSVQPAPGDENCDELLGRRTRIECVVNNTGRLGMRRYRSHEIQVLDSMPLAAKEINEFDVWEGNKVFSHLPEGSRVRLIAAPGQPTLICTDEGCWDAQGDVWNGPVTWRVSRENGVDQYRVRPQGFWQTHRRGAEVLARNVEDIAASLGASRVMELYSGAGLFSLPLSRLLGSAGRLVTLEVDEAAVADAVANVGSDVLDAFVGDCDAPAVRELNSELEGAEIIIADPPRSGAGKDVCRAMASTGAEHILLVSCDPAAASRDLHDLLEEGYQIVDMRAWDVFPYTHHFEVMTLLERI